MPAIRSLVSHDYHATNVVCDIELVCPSCAFTYTVHATKTILDAHISAVVKLKCPNCEEEFTFKVAYNSDPSAYIIYDASSNIQANWYEFFKGELLE